MELLLAGGAASLAVGGVYGIRSTAQSEAQHAATLPAGGEKFGYARAFRALGYATVIVGVGATVAVHVVCTRLDVWTAREFAAAMRERLAAPRDRMLHTLQPAGDAVGAWTKRFVHARFDQSIEELQRRLFGQAGAGGGVDGVEPIGESTARPPRAE
jgi:hypothetical protein